MTLNGIRGCSGEIQNGGGGRMKMRLQGKGTLGPLNKVLRLQG